MDPPMEQGTLNAQLELTVCSARVTGGECLYNLDCGMIVKLSPAHFLLVTISLQLLRSDQHVVDSPNHAVQR